MPGSNGSVVGRIAAVATAHPGDLAVVDDRTKWTYRDLWGRATAVAGQLVESGVERGEAIGIIGENEAGYLSTYLGVLAAGAAAVPISTMLGANEVRMQLRHVGARTVFVGRVDPDVLAALADAFDVLSITPTPHDSGVIPGPGIEAGAPGTILMTSGSTGRPKGVVHTHASLAHGVLQVASAFPFGRDQRGIAFLPFASCIPELVLPLLCTGGTVEVLPGFDPERVAAACVRATMLDCVPTAMSRLLDNADGRLLAQLDWLVFASEPMPVDLLTRWWEELPGVETNQLYGMTEALSLTYASHAMMKRAPASVGRAFPTTRLTLGAGAVDDGHGGAELLVETPARMRDYYQDPEATSAALDGEALRTGDLAAIDDEGSVYLKGRSKDLIISGGMNIVPLEIEEVARAHPAVAAVTVVGVPSPRWGETPAVVAVARPGMSLSAGDLLAHCRDGVAAYKRPSSAAVIDEIPTTGIGKVAKSVVQDRIMKGEIPVVQSC